MSPSIVVFCAAVSFVLASTFVWALVSVAVTFATRASTRAWIADSDAPPATETPPVEAPDETEASSADEAGRRWAGRRGGRAAGRGRGDPCAAHEQTCGGQRRR